MARASWFDDRIEHPLIHEKIEKLESFTTALTAWSRGRSSPARSSGWRRR